MSSGQDSTLHLLREVANNIILDVAARDPARVAGIIAEICDRLEAEGNSSHEQLRKAAEQLLRELSGGKQ